MRRIVMTWAGLVVLTGASVTAALALGPLPGSGVGAGAVITIAGFKAWIVLQEFLDLRRAPRFWKGVFLLYVGGLVLAIITAAAVSGMVRLR
jgi:cytochrome c oxidase subunit IV